MAVQSRLGSLGALFRFRGRARSWQLVPEGRRAWHAGAAAWQHEQDINSRSIGIEIANPGHDGGLPPFPEAADSKP